MLGLEKYTPFECIGQINESRLALELCRRNSLTGQAMTMFIEEIKDFDYHPAVTEYATMNSDYLAIPAEIRGKIMPLLQKVATVSQEYIVKIGSVVQVMV